MTIRIGSNISSIQAQRRLGEATSSVSTSLTRLSSGFRINRAADDAAGLAIADTLKTRSQVYSRGAKNVSDGISLLSIADSALGELGGITTRILELAEQAASGGYSVSQRKALDTEAQQLREEFFRITRATQFNGLNLFDGSIQGLRIQAGFGVDGGVASTIGGKLGSGFVVNGSGQTIAGNPLNSTIADFNGDGITDIVGDLGSVVAVQAGVGDGTFSAAVNLAAGGTIRGIETADFNNDGALDIVAAIGTTSLALLLNNNAGGFNAATTVTTGGNAVAVTVADFNNDGRMDILTGNDNGGADTVSLLLGNGTGGFGAASNLSLGVGFNPTTLARGSFNSDGLPDAVITTYTSALVIRNNGAGSFTLEAPFDIGYVSAVGDFNNDGLTDLAAGDAGSGSLFLRNSNGTSWATATSIPGITNTLGTGDMNGDGNLDLITADIDSDSFSILLGNGKGAFTDSGMQGVGYRTSFVTGDVNGDGVTDVITPSSTPLLGRARDGINPILPFSLTTQADARQAIAPLTRKLEELNKQRGVIGGFQARLSSAAQSAVSQSDGFRSAESRIRDVDVAQETARLVGAQIRQQAATAVLAQANIQPTLALRLLV